jgi:hypothetical protein
MKRIWFLGALAAGSVSLTIFSCVSDPETAVIDGGSLGDDGGSSSTTGDGASASTDGGGGGANDGGTTSCASSCTSPTMLSACFPDGSAAKIACPFDCTADGGAHCTAFVPTPPVTAADTDFTGLADVVLSSDGFLQTDNGSLDNVRAASPDAGANDTQQGVRYHVAGGVGIFTMKSLTVQVGVTLKVRGSLPAAIVADTITVKGVIDLRGYDGTGNLCTTTVAGPGGFPGGYGAKEAGAGPGGGQPAVGSGDAGGGGGGGYGGVGGASGATGPVGGPSYPFGMPLVGGSGGGSGTTSGTFNPSYGGGGGGAIQIVGVTSVTIGNVASVAGVNAGGCGGKSSGFGNLGAGGGAGGTIFIESPVLNLVDQCVLAANGGAAATGNASSPGGNGTLTNSPAAGAAVINFGTGGSGGAGTVVNGGMGTFPSGGTGGGGAVGRIRLLNYAGSFTPTGSVLISPATTTTATSVGKVGLK